MKLPFDGNVRRRLYLMRHGDALGSSEEAVRYADSTSLSATGRSQAQAMRQWLRSVPLDAAFSSDIDRAVETARIVLEGRGLVAEQRTALREVQGDFTRVLRTDGPLVRKQEDLAYCFFRAGEPGATFFGGEAYVHLLARVTGAMEDLALNGPGTTLLIVAHGGANRAALCWALGLPLAGMGSIEQDSCCLNVIDVDIDPGQRRIVRKYVRLMNLTPLDHVKAVGLLRDDELGALHFGQLYAERGAHAP